jgi:hypothetical protein
MWKIWADISHSEAIAYKERALNCMGMLKEPQVMANAFPIVVYDHHKCTSPVRHLVYTLKLTTCLFWYMGTGEAKPST